MFSMYPIDDFGEVLPKDYWENEREIAILINGKRYSLAEWTNLPTIEFYKEWCLQKRSQIFQDLLEEYSPRLIICCGLNNLLEYLRFWGASLDQLSINHVVNDKSGTESPIAISSIFNYQKETLLAVTDFCCNFNEPRSSDRAGIVGSFLLDTCSKKFGNRWLSETQK